LGYHGYKDLQVFSPYNVQTSELDQASQRRSSRKQFSVDQNFEESIKQKMVVSSHKKSKDKIVDIKSLSEKMDVSESEELSDLSFKTDLFTLDLFGVFLDTTSELILCLLLLLVLNRLLHSSRSFSFLSN
jgi:hypothetical protein